MYFNLTCSIIIMAKSHLLQINLHLTFWGARFLVCIQDKATPALAVIRGIAVDTYVLTVMPHGAWVQTWNEPGFKSWHSG